MQTAFKMDLADRVRELKKSKIRKLVDARLLEFKKTRKGSINSLFNELCFCLLTANCSAERGIRAQDEIGNGFLTLPEPELKRKVREIVCRFYNNKTKFIIQARRQKDALEPIISNKDGKEVRKWLVENICGFGYKEASHFLRNIGYDDVAIIDFHILDLLERHNLVARPKTLGTKQYLLVEKVLEDLAHKTKITLSELDLYLWYEETGKVLK